MIIEQTVDIPANHRLTIDVPCEVPAGRTIIAFTPVSTIQAVLGKSEARDIELINLNADRLNQEAMDVLSFQSMDI